jgi:hypothetical protein
VNTRLLATFASVAALAILIGGCGGDEADTAAGGTTAEVELTKDQTIKRADATCGKQNETLSTHFGEFSIANPIEDGELTQAQSSEFSQEYFVPYVEERIAYLEELEFPDADAKKLEAIIAATESGLEKAKENVDSGQSSAQDPLAKAEALSREFGFQVCGET